MRRWNGRDAPDARHYHEAADPHDTWLLALADVAQAHYLVTGDKRAGLLSRQRAGIARILTATAFCQDVSREGP